VALLRAEVLEHAIGVSLVVFVGVEIPDDEVNDSIELQVVALVSAYMKAQRAFVAEGPKFGGPAEDDDLPDVA